MIDRNQTDHYHGVQVRTVRPERESTDWSSAAKLERRWGVGGIIVDHSDSHGLCYKVVHFDGSSAWYEPRELEGIPAVPASAPSEPSIYDAILDD